MHISKHHYAIELSKLGNKVYFLNPPSLDRKFKLTRITINLIEDYENIYTIDHNLYFPYNIYFHLPRLYNFLIKKQIKLILREINNPINIIWSFDIGNLYPLKYFPSNALKIFHPVDEPSVQRGVKAAENSNIIFSVTQEILKKYDHMFIPKHLINHGISDEFLKNISINNDTKGIKVGYSGNLTRPDIDRRTLLKIINKFNDIEFHFWGPVNIKNSNISGNNDRETEQFINLLKKLKNVFLHGIVSTKDLAYEFQKVNLFLICYDIQKDQSNGTNYHKILEYLSTGKPIVSNNVTAYAKLNDLVYMASDRIENNDLIDVFDSVVSDLSKFSTNHLQEIRRTYAFNNTYKKQIERVESKLNDLKLNN